MAAIAPLQFNQRFCRATSFLSQVAFFYCLMVLCRSSFVWAQSGEQLSNSRSSKERGRLLYQKGNLAFKGEKLAEAREFYLQSLEQEETYEAECNLGQVLSELKEWSEAYFRLLICDELLPQDSEFQVTRSRYRGLSYQVRGELIEQEALGARARLDHWRQKQIEPQDRSITAKVTNTPPDALSARHSKKDPPHNRIKKRVVWSLAGVGGSAMALSIPFFIDAGVKKNKSNELRFELRRAGENCLSESASCDQLQRNLKAWDRSQNIATSLVVAGGATLISAVLVQLIWQMPEQETSFQPFWLPTARRSHLLGLRGNF